MNLRDPPALTPLGGNGWRILRDLPQHPALAPVTSRRQARRILRTYAKRSAHYAAALCFLDIQTEGGR